MWTNIETFVDEQERVTKFVFTNSQGIAESVLYRYPTYEKRTVICCSVMSGCPIGCRFCGTGDFFVRNLTTAEIVDQVVHSVAHTGISASDIQRLQIMFMSMGEPMLALKSLIPALDQLHQMYPAAALLISTSGPAVDYEPLMRVAERIDRIGLQFSVHESTDLARNVLIPYKNKLTLQEIAESGNEFADRTGRPAFFNYCAHDNNTSDIDADRLVNLFDSSKWCATVSVVCERDEGMPATNEHQRNLAATFASKLVERGFDVRMFDPAGQDTIGGGCGQLWYVQQWAAEHQVLTKQSCGAGKPVIHTPIA